MKSTLLLSLSLMLLAFSSCSTIKSNTAKTMDIYGAGVLHMPVVADLDVKSIKVTGTAVSTTAQSLDNTKNDAVSNALQTANADVLVAPVYHTEYTAGRTTVTVTGFPATYKNFRPVSQSDIPLLQVGITQVAKVSEPVQMKKKSGAVVLLAVLLGVGAVAAVVAASGVGY